MKFRTMSVAVLAGFALVAGCSASSDYETASSSKQTAAPVDVPRWIRDGVRIAKATKAARAGQSATPSRSGSQRAVTGGTTTADKLPSRDVVVAALTGAGLSATQASCMYDAVSASPQTASDVTAILKSLAGASAAPAGGTFDPASIPALASLTPESTTRLLMAIGPCLDQATIVGLLAAGQGLGGSTGAGGTDAIAALLGQAQGLDLSKLVNLDPNAIAKAAAGALGADQIAQLQQLVAAVGSAQNALPGLLSSPLLTLDISKLDLSKLTPEQMPLLVLALLKGLTSDQQGQLMKLAQVNLDQLNIKVDPDKLTPEDIGTLLLILSPLLAGAIKTTPAQPGADPGQVYIPPGADLSNINPLIFLNRADVIAQFQKQGINVNVAGCIFDGMARLEPSTIAAFFSDRAQAAAGAVLLTAVSCIAQNA